MPTQDLKKEFLVIHLQGSQSGEQRLIVIKQRVHVQTEASAEERRQTTVNTQLIKQHEMKKLNNRPDFIYYQNITRLFNNQQLTS